MGAKKKPIADQIRDALINQKALAELIGVSSATFTRKLDKNNFTKPEIKKIQTALRIVLYDYD